MSVETEKTLNITLWLVAIGLFMQNLDTTIVNTALPAMARSLGESPLRMQSVVVSYSLTVAVLIPATGWVADRFGTRRVFFAAIVLFTLGSILCAVSPTLNTLVASRVLQGVGGSMLLPVGRLAILRAFPPSRLLPALSFVAVPAMVGPLAGPVLGGWLAEQFSWHWIFLINIPVGLVCGVATWLYLADKYDEDRSPFDAMGYGLLAFSMAAISLSLDGLSGRGGVDHAWVMLLLVFGLIALVAYWLRAARQTAPLFAPSLFKIPSFSIGLLGNLFARLGSSSMPFLIPLFLQLSLGYSPSQAGLMMIPAATAGVFVKNAAPPLIRRYGYRKVLVVNTVLVGLTMGGYALISPTDPLWVQLLLMTLFGTVNSLQFTAMNTVTLKDLGQHGASAGNSMLSMVQMLSISLAVTAAGAILGAFTRLVEHETADSTLTAFRGTFICVGLITMATAWIFGQIPPDDKTAERRSKSPEEVA